MEQLEALRAKIDAFPGYADDMDRRRSDELVRAYVGERLAAMQERLAPQGTLGDQLEDLVIRTGFTNLAAFRPFEYVELSDASVAAMAKVDLAAIVSSETAAEVVEPVLIDYLAIVKAALDARDTLMIALGDPNARPGHKRTNADTH
jgi:hypothetical protein